MPLAAVTSVKLGVTVSPPATASSSVTVKVIESPSPAEASAIVTAGALDRLVGTLHGSAARLPLPSLSVATFAGTPTVTVPLADGVMMAVAIPLVSAHPVTRPLPTVTSVRSNPVTGSEKLKRTMNRPV